MISMAMLMYINIRLRSDMARKPKALPDYFTAEEAAALVAAAPSYQVRMAMRWP